MHLVSFKNVALDGIKYFIYILRFLYLVIRISDCKYLKRY